MCQKTLAFIKQRVYTTKDSKILFQGRVKFATGGKAHEPQGMIRCNSEADSKVWMEEKVIKCSYCIR
jgi:hypothetical protein